MIGNKTKIVLSGAAGSGKSTVGKLLSRTLNWPFLSMGDFSRRFAKENYQLDINAFQDLCKTDPGIDQLLEDSFIHECNAAPCAVIDYRLGFHFVPDALHVFLAVSDKEAIRRVQAAGRVNEDALLIPERNRKMRERFIEYYELDFMEMSNYHLVIATDGKPPEEICRLIQLEL